MASQGIPSCHREVPVTNDTLGEPISTKNALLTTASGATQDFSPLKNICAYLNAFHVYAAEPHRFVEAYHYCAHLNEDVRQCLIYDSDSKNARLIGVEYMITPKLYGTLEPEERALWHSHVFEVKSGQLMMPRPSVVPVSVWEAAENKEMEQTVKLYGKTYHFWDIDKGDKLPLGPPKLMMSFTSKEQFPFDEEVGKRDEKLGENYRRKAEIRAYIPEPEIHPDADQWPKKPCPTCKK